MFGIRSGVILTYDITPNTRMATTATNTVNGFFTLKEVIGQDPFGNRIHSFHDSTAPPQNREFSLNFNEKTRRSRILAAS